jgi:hypothetical protein
MRFTACGAQKDYALNAPIRARAVPTTEVNRLLLAHRPSSKQKTNCTSDRHPLNAIAIDYNWF